MRKIDDVHNVLEITDERIQEIFKQQLVSNLTASYLSCCDFYTNELVKAYPPSNLYVNEYELKLMNNLKAKEHDIKKARYQYDSHFNTQINKQYACDISEDFRRAHFFTPSGPNLTQQFQANLDLYPNIKWQYFMTFLGVHTEYPSYLPPNNYCFLHTINNEQFGLKSVSEHSNDRAYPKRKFACIRVLLN